MSPNTNFVSLLYSMLSLAFLSVWLATVVILLCADDFFVLDLVALELEVELRRCLRDFFLDIALPFMQIYYQKILMVAKLKPSYI